MRRKRIHGHRRVTRSPLKHSEEEAGYKHPESMHKDYPPKMMDAIKKENPNATFSPKKEYDPKANIDRPV